MNKPKLTKGIVGGDIDTWGDKLNKNIDSQDTFNQELIDDSSRQDQELARLEKDKISQSEIATVVKTTVDNYVDNTTKPQLNQYVETVSKIEINKHTDTKLNILDQFTEEQNTELDKRCEDEKAELDTHEKAKESELDAHGLVKQNEITLHTNDEISRISTHTTTIEIPKLTHQADIEIERIHATGIDGKQDKVDQTLQTTSKEVVGAINETLNKTKENKMSIETLSNKTITEGSGIKVAGTFGNNLKIDVVSEDEGILVNEKLKLNIVDDLLTGGVKRPLSAEQGKVLKQLIDAIGSGGATRLMRQAEALSEYDYMGSLPANDTSIAVGQQLFDPTLYLNGVRLESNKYSVELKTGLITLITPYSDTYDVIWVVEDQMPHHISFCFPTMQLLLSSEDVKAKIKIEDVVKILGESDADDGGHYLVKCEATAKLNPIELSVGKYLNEIPNTRIATLKSEIEQNKSDILLKANISDIPTLIGEISKTGNGWCRFANGLILQWGVATTSNVGTGEGFLRVVTPITFTTACRAFSTISSTSSVRITNFLTNAQVESTNTLKIFTRNIASSEIEPTVTFAWLAIGY